MEKLTIRCHVPQATAILAGVCQYGDCDYQVRDEDLATLASDHRRWLMLYTPNAPSRRYVPDYLTGVGNPKVYPGWPAYGAVSAGPLVLDASVVTWDAIVEAIRRDAARAAAYVAKDAERAAELDAERTDRAARARSWLEQWSAVTDDKLVTVHGVQTCTDAEGRFVLSGNAPPIDDLTPEDRARYERRKERLDGMLAGYRKVEDDSRRAMLQAAVDAVAAYAATVPTLARAAQDGYDVGDAAIHAFACRVTDAIGDAIGVDNVTLYVSDTPAFGRVDWSERRAPSPCAFEVLDKVERVLKDHKVPEPFDVSISRIKRIKVASALEDGRAEHYTGIVVEVGCVPPVKGIRDRVVLVSAE